eukprot:scaffold61872_cov61-Phaeocystis_antarctica.AAC.2
MVSPHDSSPAGSSTSAWRNCVMRQTKLPPSIGSKACRPLAANLCGSPHTSSSGMPPAGSMSGLETACVAIKAATPAARPARALAAPSAAGSREGRALTMPVRSSKWRRRAASLTARTAGSRPMRTSSAYISDSLAPMPSSFMGSGATSEGPRCFERKPRTNCASITRTPCAGENELA